ncbi:HEAT repeat domain-containing protein [Gemmatimonas groenlandica]|uniref:HEAT repeat domain-containing protein n=1 Tax=Gemmatimonas groenlandica TaxID=2732249 RepID=A0A6M4ISX0_9BACT|nr:HEAT repeat domain-containing protein [Gemmatimonas groenlandica]QJR37823.1 HEAT repeat domain-containing protein [Gemmatimonas groenlandica]
MLTTSIDAESRAGAMMRRPGWRLEPKLSMPCCETLSQLLDLLAGGAPTSEIARAVARAQQLAAGGDILVVRDAATLTVNDTPAAPETVASLHRMLCEHSVCEVAIDRHVAERDLLQLAALLNGSARANGPSFVELWQRLGVWRITLQFDQSAGVAAERDDHTLATQWSRRLADAVDGDHPEAALAIMRAVLQAEQDAPEPTRAEAAARFDELATPAVLRLLGRLIPMGEPVRTPDNPLRAVFVRSGDRAATALFAQLSAAPTAGERRMVFDAIVAIGHSSPLFISSLHHSSWYVVRNAAALLGALPGTDTDHALVQTLRHPDTRVRVAVVQALGQLGTPLAGQALLLAMNDGSSDVRHAALQSLDAMKASLPSTLLTAALEREDREVVQLDLISALSGCTDHETMYALSRFCARVLARGGAVSAALAAIEVMVGHRASSVTNFLRFLDSHDDAGVRARVARLRARAEPSLPVT